MFRTITFLLAISTIFGCRSEFGYKNPSKDTILKPKPKIFKIVADKMTVNPKGYGNSVVNFTADCQLSGQKVIDWQMTPTDSLQGDKVSFEFTEAKRHIVKAYCRNGQETLTAAVTIHVGDIYNPRTDQNPPSYDGKGNDGRPIHERYDIPPQPYWEYERSLRYSK